MSGLPTSIPGAWTPSTFQPYQPYFGYGSSNQVYSNSLSVENVPDDGDGENQPSRPYIPDSSDSVTFAAFGNVPNVYGGQAAANQITLEPADATHPGGISILAQSLAGPKTFVDDIFALKTIRLPATSDISHGAVYINTQPFMHSYGSFSNTFLGANSCIGNAPAPTGENTGIGNSCLTAIIGTAQGNTAVGSGCLPALQTGVGNTAVGWTAMTSCVSGSNNVALGDFALANCTGSRNIAVGYQAGSAVVANVDTINIGSAGTTTSGEINIGTNGTHTTCTIAGIASVAVGGTPQLVTINPATNQLGSQAIAGVLSVGPIAAGPVANGASITGTVLNLAAATATSGGVLNNTTQSIQGNKTFIDQLSGGRNISVSNTTSVGVGNILAGNLILHNYSVNASKSNVWCGYACGNYTTDSTNNVGIGNGALSAVTTGGVNVCIGQNAGNTLTSTSNNVMIANTGVVGDAGCIKIGTGGTHTSCYVAGIQGVAVSSVTGIVTCNASNQLGSVAYSTTTVTNTVTLDVGTITTMTIRGAATTSMTIALSKIGTQVSMIIPAFQMTAQTGSALTYNLAGAGIPAAYRPTYSLSATCTLRANTNFVSAEVYVTSGGLVSIQSRDGSAFILPSGFLYDLAVQWIIAP